MTSTAAAAAAAAAINSVSSYALSPHAAPFNPPSRPACAPFQYRQNGDVSRSAGASSVGYAEEKTSRDTHSASPIACALMKSSGAVYPPSTHAMHTGQPSSWSAVCLDAYPSSPYVGITSNYKQQNSLTSGNGSKCSTVRIERPPNKTSETNKNSCGSGSKLVIAENPKSNKYSEKETSSRSLQLNGPVDGNDNSQDPSECSVDSPCYRGASASRLSPFDVFQTPATQLTNQELEAFAVRQKQSSSAVQHHETSSELQSLVTKTNHDHCKSQAEAGVSKKSGVTSIKETKNSCGKELECANQYAAKCELEQKHLLKLRDNYVKRSGLNYAAPDFVPSSTGKSKIGKGPCSSTGKNISGVLKATENLTVVFQSSYSGDEIELDEDDCILLESVIDSLQTCLHKIRKDPIKGASDKAGPKAPHSQTAVLKYDPGKYSRSYIADGEKDIMINHFAGSSHMHNEFGRNSLTRGKPALNNVQKMSCEEEHPQVLVYKNLWIEAERANCELKYQLKHTCIKIDLESSMAPIGGPGPRKNYSQVSDLSTDPSNLYGVALAHPTGETSGARNGQYLPYAGDCTRSAGDAALSCSSSTKGYTALPKNLQHGHVLSGLEETATQRHAPLPYGACQGLNGGTLDGVAAHSYITGQDGILRSNSKYGSSDWEHVLTEEIGWS
ncbi:uncharacterized protein [Triticum aestivum]|uniref:uncharacterized protein isoform X3 n=1 Tax=Triticum aestivum TaxID=4565 RepID=UPI001D01E1D6|nr:uncharacterized protein LOC123160845 isoform X3 [Triticum aestivum]